VAGLTAGEVRGDGDLIVRERAEPAARRAVPLRERGSTDDAVCGFILDRDLARPVYSVFTVDTVHPVDSGETVGARRTVLPIVSVGSVHTVDAVYSLRPGGAFGASAGGDRREEEAE
jgi:hypothetical protein